MAQVTKVPGCQLQVCQDVPKAKRHITSCSAQPCPYRDIQPPAAPGTVITHLDGWCGKKPQPEPAKPSPITPRRKLKRMKQQEEAKKIEYLG